MPFSEGPGTDGTAETSLTRPLVVSDSWVGSWEPPLRESKSAGPNAYVNNTNVGAFGVPQRKTVKYLRCLLQHLKKRGERRERQKK